MRSNVKYATKVGQNYRLGMDRFVAYQAALTTLNTHRFVTVISYVRLPRGEGAEVECRLVKQADGGIKVVTPNLEDKYEISKFVGEVFASLGDYNLDPAA